MLDMAARGEISQEEAEDVLNRFREKVRSGMGRRAARDAVQAEEEFKGAQERRQQMLTVAAHDKIVKDIGQFRTASDKRDVFEAGNSLFEDFGYAGYPSARFMGEALIGMAHSRMADFLDHFARKTLYSNASMIGGRQNVADLDDVQRAMFGERVPAKAKALADMAMEQMEWLRTLFNEKSGDTIPKLEKWGGPQSHNPDAVIRSGGFKKDPLKAKAHWTGYIEPRLNWKEMRDPMTGEKFEQIPTIARRNAILGHAWDSIVTDGRINRSPSAQRGGGSSVANSRSDHRFFVFKDADSKIGYNREYGDGDVFNQTMDHIHGMARDIAMMDRFGPNPAGQIEWLKQLYDQEAAKTATGKPSMLEGYNHLTVLAKAQRAKAMLDGFYEQYRGSNAAKGWLALSGTILRNNAMGSLLGSSAIAHATSNWYIQTMARRLGGIPAAKVLPELLTSFKKATKEEILRAGLDVEQGMFHLGAGARQLGALQKVANWTRWLPDRTVHWGGLIPIVEANKASFFRGTMSYLADLQKTDWANLPERIKNKFIGYGMREADWKIMQMADLHTPDVGSAKWLRHPEVNAVGAKRPEDVLRAIGRADLARHVPGSNHAGLSDQAMETAQRASFETALKMLGYMHGEREVAVPANSWRAKAFLQGGTDPNTFWGQIRQSASLFKGFIGSMMVTQFQGMQHELARSKVKGAAYIGSFVIGMSVMGLLTLQLKQMAAGKDPASMDPLTPEGRATIAHGILMSGSFGIFGDFLASDLSSFGRGLLETLAGPGLSIPMDLSQGVIDLARSKMSGANKKPMSGIVSDSTQKFLRGNSSSLSSLWYLRAAYQRIILDQLQFLMDSSAHMKQRQQEIRLQKETGQHYWWAPGSVFPSRAPQFTQGH